MVNYRDLLIKYINHVSSEAGVDSGFIYEPLLSSFNDEEKTMLKILALEAKLEEEK